MKAIRKLAAIAVVLTIVSSATLTIAADKSSEKKAKPKEVVPRIQMAILLDTSGSMSGLINQARTQLWTIVNEFATAKRDGKTPHLEVALYEYGKSSLPAKEGYMRMIVPLTDNLDQVSDELFKLTTNGGSEYCGQAIDLAVRELDWSEANKDLKCIFIAGNEPFTQGPINFRDACKAAVSKNITVSTIHCGTESDGLNGQWDQGAKLADGSFLNIDHDRAVASIAAPQDKELAELSGKLNTTYLAYGSAEKKLRSLELQTRQDANAAGAAPAAAAARAKTKASSFYRNSSWDLLDAVKEGKVKLEEMKEDELPDDMKKLKPEEREAYLAEKEKERADIQARIKELSKERDAYLVEARKKAVETGAETLDTAIIKTVRDQAERLEFEFKE
jgi:hypothetical protein